VFIKTVVIDAADKAKRVSRRFEIDRRPPPESARHGGWICDCCGRTTPGRRASTALTHDFIRRRGAVEDKIGFVGIKDPGRELLRVLRRAFVDQQVPKFHIGIAHIGTKDVLAKEVKKLAARRVFLKNAPC
jgi:hypothetical protein